MKKYLLLILLSFGVNTLYAQTSEDYERLLQRVEMLEAEVQEEKAAEKEGFTTR